MRRRNREAELQFLWGSEGYEKKEQPRLQFRGKIDKDAVTGAKVLVHASETPTDDRRVKLVISMGIVIVCIVAVIVGAVGAFLIRYAVETVQESCLNPCSTVEYVRPTAPFLAAADLLLSQAQTKTCCAWAGAVGNGLEADGSVRRRGRSAGVE